MKSNDDGKNTLEPEVTQVDRQGIWLLINDREYFLPYEKFPRFRDATIRQIHNVHLIDNGELRWPDLGINLTVESIGQPELVPDFST